MPHKLNLTPEEWKARKLDQRHASQARNRKTRALITGEVLLDPQWEEAAKESLDRISKKYRS